MKFMKKLGIYGIVSGIAAAIYMVALVLYAYLKAVTNFREFGADLKYFVRPFSLKLLAEEWLMFLMLIIFAILNIVLGIQLTKQNVGALRIWILYYALLAAVYAVCVGTNKLFLLDFMWCGIVLYISINIFKKQNKLGSKTEHC